MALNLDDLIGSMQHVSAGDRGSELNAMREELRAVLGAQALGPDASLHQQQAQQQQQQTQAQQAPMATTRPRRGEDTGSGGMSWRAEPASAGKWGSVGGGSEGEAQSMAVSFGMGLAGSSSSNTGGTGGYRPSYGYTAGSSSGAGGNPAFGVRIPGSASTTYSSSSHYSSAAPGGLSPSPYTSPFGTMGSMGSYSGATSVSAATSAGSNASVASGAAHAPANTPQQTPVERGVAGPGPGPWPPALLQALQEEGQDEYAAQRNSSDPPTSPRKAVGFAPENQSGW